MKKDLLLAGRLIIKGSETAALFIIGGNYAFQGGGCFDDAIDY